MQPVHNCTLTQTFNSHFCKESRELHSFKVVRQPNPAYLPLGGQGPPLPLGGPPRPLPLPRAACARRMADLPLPAAPVLAAPLPPRPAVLNMGAFFNMSGNMRNLKEKKC